MQESEQVALNGERNRDAETSREHSTVQDFLACEGDQRFATLKLLFGTLIFKLVMKK